MIRSPAPVVAGLPAGIVDTWRVPLQPESAAHGRWRGLLSEDERGHAERMRVAGNAWATARGALRDILSRYVDEAPETLAFERGALGKPRLAGRQAPQFNVAWRPELALVAVASDRDVGVDLERVRDDADVGTLARDHLPPLEQAAIVHEPPHHQRSAFFAAWVRHEARRKLHGLGLEDPLPELTGSEIVVVRALDVAPGWTAAVAAEGGSWRVRRREVPELA